jgi:hypothetical protein
MLNFFIESYILLTSYIYYFEILYYLLKLFVIDKQIQSVVFRLFTVSRECYLKL